MGAGVREGYFSQGARGWSGDGQEEEQLLKGVSGWGGRKGVQVYQERLGRRGREEENDRNWYLKIFFIY